MQNRALQAESYTMFHATVETDDTVRAVTKASDEAAAHHNERVSHPHPQESKHRRDLGNAKSTNHQTSF